MVSRVYFYSYAYLLILNTGLRMGEALSLCWRNIDFENKTLIVTKNNVMTKERDKNGNIVGGYQLQTQTTMLLTRDICRVRIKK